LGKFEKGHSLNVRFGPDNRISKWEVVDFF